MCGRYASFRQAQDLADIFDIEIGEITAAAAEVATSWNIAPTAGVRVVIEREHRQLHRARWGLLPPWAKHLKDGPPLFNARVETAAHKRSFAPSLATRRCVVPAEGYYEWRRDDPATTSKTPFFIHAEDGAPLALAGLYAFWRDRSLPDDDPDRWVLTVTILTTAARDGLEQIHDREPVMLAHGQLGSWLDPAQLDPETALAVLAAPPPPLAWHEVAPAVGSTRVDHSGLVDPT